MPKEKKSAVCAMRLAVRAARGSSIMQPIGISIDWLWASATSVMISSAWRRTMTSSRLDPMSGTMISGCGS